MATVGKRIVIVGTGGMGREAAAWVADACPDDDLLGFLDDDASSHGATVADLPVLGGLDWLAGQVDVEVVPAIGAPGGRARLLARLAAADVPLATIVHPTAVVGLRTRIDAGAIVCPRVVLTCDVHVGRGTILNYGALVGHDGRLGEACSIAPGAHLAGKVTVGAQADIGIGASVIQRITIGEGAIVGAGAVVIRDVAPGTTVVGVPAKPIGGAR
jgi:sugar O-acyltransferase (sialic acid O-acetyltransferase NeuD family)